MSYRYTFTPAEVKEVRAATGRRLKECRAILVRRQLRQDLAVLNSRDVPGWYSMENRMEVMEEMVKGTMEILEAIMDELL